MTEISVRDYFAGQAISAFVGSGHSDPRRIAAQCYALADALLAVRSGQPARDEAEAIPADVATSKGGLALT